MKRNFIIGMFLAPLLILLYWGIKTLFTPGVSVSEVEEKDILAELNYTTEYAGGILPGFSFSMGENGTVKEAKLADFKGKPTIIHIWATWCGPCLKELPEFSDFVKKYKHKYNIIAVSADVSDSLAETQKIVDDLWREKNYNSVRMVYDFEAQLSRGFGIAGVPTTIFLNADGKEIGRINGAMYWMDPKIMIIVERLLKS